MARAGMVEPERYYRARREAERAPEDWPWWELPRAWVLDGTVYVTWDRMVRVVPPFDTMGTWDVLDY